MGNVKKEVKKAYYDSNSDKSFEEASNVRDLNFLASKPVSVDWAEEIMMEAVPNGYNMFMAEDSINRVASLFQGKPKVIIARESSVCLYYVGKLRVGAKEVLGNGRLRTPRDVDIDADEYSAESGEEFIERIESEDRSRRSDREVTDEIREAVKGKRVHRFWWD